MSIPTPTEPFSHLSLEPRSPATPSPTSPMATPETLRARARMIQDVLSTFNDTALPTETVPDYFKNVDENADRSPSQRPRSSEWTIPGRLEASILQWGSYHDQSFEVVSLWQSTDNRAKIFQEKLKSRLNDQLSIYDSIAQEPPNSLTRLKDMLGPLINDFRRLSGIFSDDRQRRQSEAVALVPEVEMLAVALDTLDAVCQRSQPIVPIGAESSRRTRRRVSSEPGISLFGLLILQPDTEQSPFLLEGLDQFSTSVLKACTAKLISIEELLRTKMAPKSYVDTIEALLERAEETPLGPAHPSGPGSGRRRGLEAEPRPGSKRTQPGAELETPKRGKRSDGR
ncbi:hypothetical protein LTR64_008494 [Lithohypha guttulata]|uniref:uncharacterized protein n=1 Tax=Lithohypha guttulata TaxID=1690604 RepID=UPI002DE13D57|nr:hypothetical protein LTR51_001741 [Lithohypha guttulata]